MFGLSKKSGKIILASVLVFILMLFCSLMINVISTAVANGRANDLQEQINQSQRQIEQNQREIEHLQSLEHIEQAARDLNMQRENENFFVAV